MITISDTDDTASSTPAPIKFTVVQELSGLKWFLSKNWSSLEFIVFMAPTDYKLASLILMNLRDEINFDFTKALEPTREINFYKPDKTGKSIIHSSTHEVLLSLIEKCTNVLN